MDIALLIITVTINLLLGTIIFLRDRHAAYAQRFGAMSLLICLWIASNYITNHDDWNNLLVNDITNRIAYLAGLGSVIAGLLFTYVFPTIYKVGRAEKISLWVITAGMGLLSVTDLVAGTVTRDENGLLVFSVAPLLWLYAVAFIVVVGLLAKNLLSNVRKSNNIRRRQSVLLLFAFCSTALTGLFLNVILPLVGISWDVTRFGPLSTLLLVVVVAYTIVKHGLFDIRLAAVRSVAYVLSLVTFCVIYYIFSFIITSTLFQGDVRAAASINPINVFLAILLVFLFQPIKSFFDKFTNNIFYRDRYDTTDFYARLGGVLTTTTDLRSLLERASQEIGDTLKSEHTFFFVQYKHGHHITAGTKRQTEIPFADIRSLSEYVKKEKLEIIVAELLPDNHPIQRLLISYRLAILMPLVRGTVIFGYLALGDKRSGEYTDHDIRALTTISDELTIAIQNVLSVQEIKDININLQQRIDAATAELRTSNTQLRHLDKTKDEFLSMASHQLRTPLTSVKGYLSMVLDGDTGKITRAQKQLLSEAYASSERMVHLIHDFLNVSRLQTGKFILELHPYDIAKLVEEEVKSLQRAAQVRNMKLTFANHLKKGLVLNIDENKLRQVVMNFIDNALFYSHDNSVIDVVLTKKDGHVIVKVKDSGIGVPKAEQSQLFTKFYRASNARKQRPDGTGVGIFLAKKVVTDHGGDVLFESVEGKGSTFGFTLPIARLQALLEKQPDKLDNK